MGWIKTSDRLPRAGAEIQCRLKHFNTKGVLEHRLVKVEEDDCSWRTADDHSEISYDWDVVEWYEETDQDAPNQ
ncbi:hypothetical protein FA341_31685 [Pseudomonas aeruginosa]|uniref:hypothetical protein n=1 Tax=Pseudomonas aeruginosa TaxID=287 RepID=UPI000CFB35B8|nr:hypothetical protein [Pseudomonas aeruginosa]EIU2643002.1 hypothetical protein [Pseudomonas aeruginosa]EIU9551293.1 hypothetical protein [Pseudomonas aeruginosa]EJY6032818.1 hypothetical protein [Pseudomonas aeruginosa]EKC7897121.1 hypothetical protein [Pseudomonas aeruginosa]EKM9120052.1 hypothetical protein [Pseudomonas aeruginosa]